jgi:hypothetical protein
LKDYKTLLMSLLIRFNEVVNGKYNSRAIKVNQF